MQPELARISLNAPAGPPNVNLTTREAADFLRVTPRALEKWRVEGRGPSFLSYSSRCVRYPLASLLEWQESRRRTSTHSRPHDG